MKSNNQGKAALIITIVISILLIAGTATGVWYWQKTKTDSEKIKLEQQKADLEKKIDELGQQKEEISDETADWQDGNFDTLSFKYPKSWTKDEKNSSANIMYLRTDVTKKDSLNNETVALLIIFEKFTYDGSGLENAIEILSNTGQGFGLNNKQNFTINSTSALRYNSGCCGSRTDSIFFIVNNNLYKISASVGNVLTQDDLNNFKPEFEKFLKTVSFNK